MTGNETTNHEDSLDRAIDAMRNGFSDDALRASTSRFRSSLPAPPVQPRWAGRLRWAAAVLGMVAVIAVGPLLVPGTTGLAFAAVQEWFERFETVHTETIIRQDGAVLTEIRVWADRWGWARIETGPVTHILDPEVGALFTVLPGDQVMSTIIPDFEPAAAPAAWPGDDSASEWFTDIRDFQGEALPLRQTRTIDGVVARGYHLELDAGIFTLWADNVTDRPILLEAKLAAGLKLESRLWFDDVFPEGLFELPPNARDFGDR